MQMSSLDDSTNQDTSAKRNIVKGMDKTRILKLQRNLRIIPRNICLISGAPRSGTTALCDWLSLQRGVAAFSESRILVSIHRFMEEVHRFRNLETNRAMISRLARNLVKDYYSGSQKLLGKRLLVDKEPLEPVAFPLKDYEKFIVNVRSVFPEIKLLFVLRDPISTIWSMSRRKWGGSLTDAQSKEFTLEEYIENWRSCANLISKYKSDSNSYIVQYGQLIKEPDRESQRIYGFLKIKGKSFQPRKTKKIAFSKIEMDLILQAVRPQLEMLSARGISYL
jgi:hypothetical protein